MQLKKLVACAAIGCALGAAGIGATSAVASAAPPCGPGPGAQCGPGGGPGGPGPGGERGGPPQGGDRGGPPGQRFGAPPDGNRGPGAPPGGPPGDNRGPGGGGPAGPPRDFRGPGGPVGPVGQNFRTPDNTTGDRRGTPTTTIGAAGSPVRHGVPDCRRGAGARRRHRSGTDRSPQRGDRHRHPSTTTASTSSRCGTRVTTSGASISSGFGYRSRSDVIQRMAVPTTGAAIFKSLERVPDREVLGSTDERRRGVLGIARQFNRLQSR